MMDMYKGVVCCKLLSLSLQVLWVYSSGTLVRGKNVIIVLLVKTTCLGEVLSNLKLFQICVIYVIYISHKYIYVTTLYIYAYANRKIHLYVYVYIHLYT